MISSPIPPMPCMSLDKLVAVLDQAGVVGAGGGGFALASKILARPYSVLVINGVESEPLIYKDRAVLEQTPDCVMRGGAIIANTLGLERVVLVIRKEYSDLYQSLRQRANSFALDVAVVPDLYPLGYEKTLLAYLFGQRCNAGDYLVCNVETMRNTAWAVAGQPVRRKMISVAGAVQQPTSMDVPLGTPFLDCLHLAGGAVDEQYAVFDGGALSGQCAQAQTLSVSASSKGYVVVAKTHPLVRRLEGAATDWRDQARERNRQKFFFGPDCAILRGRLLPVTTVYDLLDLKPYRWSHYRQVRMEQQQTTS